MNEINNLSDQLKNCSIEILRLDQKIELQFQQ